MASNVTDKVMDPPSMQFHSSLDLVKPKSCIEYASEQEKRGAMSIIEKRVDLSIDEKSPFNAYFFYFICFDYFTYVYIIIWISIYVYTNQL